MAGPGSKSIGGAEPIFLAASPDVAGEADLPREGRRASPAKTDPAALRLPAARAGRRPDHDGPWTLAGAPPETAPKAIADALALKDHLFWLLLPTGEIEKSRRRDRLRAARLFPWSVTRHRGGRRRPSFNRRSGSRCHRSPA